MRPNDRDLAQLGPWTAGANNLAQETSVPARSFRDGLNVDLSDDGKVKRRRGYTLVEPAFEPSSIIGFGNRGFYLTNGELMAFEVVDRQMIGVVPIYSGLRQDARLAAVLIEPDIFVSDGDTNLRIAPDNSVRDWALPQADNPTVGITPDAGGLELGDYMIALAYKAASGEEGPLSQAVKVSLTAAQSQLTVALPTAYSARVAIYMTKPNGTELLLAGVAPLGAASITINKQRLGRRAETDFLSPFPPCTFAVYFRGRLLGANGSTLFWSEPQLYSLTDLGFNFFEYAEPITGLGVIGDVGNGVFLGQQSKTYFLRGDNPAEMESREAYPAGMVAHSLTMVPGARLPMESPPPVPVPMWLATNGVICVGLPDGTVLPLSETRYAARVGDTGASVFIQRDGRSSFVATTQEPRDNVFAVTDQVTIEIVRNGIPQQT